MFDHHLMAKNKIINILLKKTFTHAKLKNNRLLPNQTLGPPAEKMSVSSLRNTS